ncbi:G-type lectin S-receptor-like serine/threonine-protein kinase [Camellia lanceoleosa]|uniref:G-type lectin S-receptor-like serine/threonine-protein kinase n=1 Tax=Camellia lanceoleosa TaxID=1840588 RepID=A0ACC0GPM9_9ERIC|nr:G-type lectin S-receptor-like serine/threonine-protein kinase [Camellia lanceoleosa]
MKQPHSVGVVFSLSFFLFFFIIISAAAADISPGSTLKASNPNHTWTSPNTTFSLSFISDDGAAFFAAITYNGIPIWIAGASDPGGGASDSSASLQFLADGNLRLVNGSSSSAVVWQSNTAGRGVSSAALHDSGNFVLRNATVSVWSTFDNPTDTILPSQNFTINKVLRSGLYSFSLLSSGNLTLKWSNTILYWNFGLNSSFHSNLTSPNLVLQSIGALSLHDQSLSSPVAMVYSSDYAEGSDIIRFLKLENDGNLRIYSSVKGTRTSIVRWVAVKDQCQVFGYCGNMGICSYNYSKPICICPSMNFDPIDPKDSRKGCKRKTNIKDCPKTVTMLQLNHTEFLTYPPDIPSQIFFMSTSTSRLNCITSSPCIAATSLSDGTGRIYMKFPGFVSGYRSPTLPSTSFLKVCGPIILPRRNDWRLHARIVLVVVIGTAVGFILLEAEFERGNVMEIVDARLLDDHKADMEQVMRAIQVSFWCIQGEPSKRPTMGRVVQMLEGIVEIEKPPAPKAVEEMSVIGTIVNGRNVERASSSLLRSEHKWSSDC